MSALFLSGILLQNNLDITRYLNKAAATLDRTPFPYRLLYLKCCTGSRTPPPRRQDLTHWATNIPCSFLVCLDVLHTKLMANATFCHYDLFGQNIHMDIHLVYSMNLTELTQTLRPQTSQEYFIKWLQNRILYLRKGKGSSSFRFLSSGFFSP